MPYSGDVRMGGGFLREAGGELDVTTDATGAFWDTGFLRSPTGELVVTTSTAGAAMQGGFLRAANGALVVEDAEPVEVSGGLYRTASGALAVENAGTFAMSQGKLRTSTGRIAMPDIVASFDPGTLSPDAWLKGDAHVGANNDPVTTIENFGSAADFVQATSANKPTFKTNVVNGKAAFLFDGADDFMTSTLTGSPSRRTLFAVAVLDSPTTGHTILGSSSDGGFDFHRAGDASAELTAQGVTSIGKLTDPFVSGTPLLLRAIADDSTNAWSIAKNGGAATSGSTAFAFTGSLTSVLGRGASGIFFWKGYICELLVFDGVTVAAGDVTSLESYLTSKWAVS
jgi:hypothetical protein